MKRWSPINTGRLNDPLRLIFTHSLLKETLQHLHRRALRVDHLLRGTCSFCSSQRAFRLVVLQFPRRPAALTGTAREDAKKAVLAVPRDDRDKVAHGRRLDISRGLWLGSTPAAFSLGSGAKSPTPTPTPETTTVDVSARTAELMLVHYLLASLGNRHRSRWARARATKCLSSTFACCSSDKQTFAASEVAQTPACHLPQPVSSDLATHERQSGKLPSDLVGPVHMLDASVAVQNLSGTHICGSLHNPKHPTVNACPVEQDVKVNLP